MQLTGNGSPQHRDGHEMGARLRALTGHSTPYSCLDRVLWASAEWKKPRVERQDPFKNELFHFLSDAGRDCSARPAPWLFDLTSTFSAPYSPN